VGIGEGCGVRGVGRENPGALRSEEETLVYSPEALMLHVQVHGRGSQRDVCIELATPK